MELKLRIYVYNFPFFRILLIVPYGIETGEAMGEGGAECLLIVPYGIETGSRPPSLH